MLVRGAAFAINLSKHIKNSSEDSFCQASVCVYFFLAFRFLQGIGSINTPLRGFYCRSLILGMVLLALLLIVILPKHFGCCLFSLPDWCWNRDYKNLQCTEKVPGFMLPARHRLHTDNFTSHDTLLIEIKRQVARGEYD